MFAGVFIILIILFFARTLTQHFRYRKRMLELQEEEKRLKEQEARDGKKILTSIYYNHPIRINPGVILYLWEHVLSYRVMSLGF